MPKRNVYDTTIQFKDKENKAEKMRQCLEGEYTLTTEAICGLLLCNRKYIDDYIKPNVANIFISARQMKWIATTLKLDQSFVDSHRSYYYFSKESFMGYIQRIIICTRQTIRINLMEYMKEEVKEGTENYKTVIEHIKKKEFEQAKEYLNTKGIVLYSKAITNSTKRKLTSVMEVKNPIKLEDLPLLRASGSSNNERFYRQAYANGYIKVKLNGKSFFINPSKGAIINWGITLSYEEYCDICY